MKIKLISEEKIRTEKPLDELWLQLRLFESEYYSKQFLKEKYSDIKDEELNKLSVIFSSNIKQAYEYYSAASSVSILTSPLLYYYGMMCLTNVLWASLNKTEEINPRHGLNNPNPKDLAPLLSNEYVIVQKNGSFPALHSCFSDFPIKADTKFYIKEVFSVIPELKTLYEKICGEKSRLIESTGRGIILFSWYGDDSRFKEVFKNNEDFFKNHNVEPHSGHFGDEFDGISYQYPLINTQLDYPLQKSMNGEIYFTLPIEFEKKAYAVPEASAQFMVMHCLGMLVRYEPVKWLQIVSGKESSDINLINQFIEISKRKFPNMVLNGLLSKNIKFIMNNENNSYTTRYIA